MQPTLLSPIMQFRARITRTTGLSVIMTALTYNPRLYNKLKGNCSSHRPVEDGDSQTKKNFRYFFWSFFYCTVVPTICNPLFRMFMAALRSRWWCVWQCGHSQFLMCKFCFPLIFLFLFWHLLHICVDG